MKIKKTKVADLKMSYAVGFFSCEDGVKGIAASEGEEKCFLFDLENPSMMETVWGHAGGTMSIAQIDTKGSFLAVQNFFKGFNSKTACIVRAEHQNKGEWLVEKYIDLPYVHRFDVIDAANQKFILACTLCDDKEFKEDWSKPGRVWLGRLPENAGDRCELKPLINGITKNHGFYKGKLFGKNVVLISGMEGLFEVEIPQNPGDDWKYHKIIEREISDSTVVDIDEDGVDEIVTIEQFHGNRIVINKLIDDVWKEVYSYPVNFGHAVWGGRILGQESLLVGYRGDNAALMLLRKKKCDGFFMEHIFIDEHEGPTNLSVISEEKQCTILCSCGKTQQVVLYQLTNDIEQKGALLCQM